MAKGKFLSIRSDKDEKDGAKRPIVVDFGSRKANLVSSDEVGFETEAERRIARLRMVASLVEGCRLPLDPEEMQSLGGLLHQIANDLDGEVFLHYFEENELDSARAQ